jgi:roadblock/LC7 domain-containing protein
MLGTVALAAQQTQTITVTGTISDTMCAAHHMMKNTSAAECTRMCVKKVPGTKNSGYALVVGNKIYTLKGNAAQLTEVNKYAGQNVTIKGQVPVLSKGEVTGSLIFVSSIFPAS